jgi:hypothetical protein
MRARRPVPRSSPVLRRKIKRRSSPSQTAGKKRHTRARERHRATAPGMASPAYYICVQHFVVSLYKVSSIHDFPCQEENCTLYASTTNFAGFHARASLADESGGYSCAVCGRPRSLRLPSIRGLYAVATRPNFSVRTRLRAPRRVSRSVSEDASTGDLPKPRLRRWSTVC